MSTPTEEDLDAIPDDEPLDLPDVTKDETTAGKTTIPGDTGATDK
jgi:hypothetical protein